MKTEKKEYTAPALTVVTFKVEQGYALSGLGLTFLFHLEDDAPSQEQWVEDNSYFGYSWH